jgi:hypothetical protein
MHRRIAIVTPVLDDWPSFSTLVERLAGVFAGIDCSVHVLAVDDGSASVPPPGSICLPRDGPVAEVSVLRLAVNLGHQRAIAAGLSRIAKRDDIDAVVVMDSDGEDRPEDVMPLCAANEGHPDAVIFAARASRAESPVFKAGYRAYKLLFRLLTGRSINFGNFSLLPMPVVRRLVFMPELWNNLPAAVVRSRIPYVTIPVRRGTRYAGASKMNLPALIVHGMSAMSVYTDVIFVRVLMAAALVATLSVLGMFVVVMIRLFTQFYVLGWASTVFGSLVIVLMQTLVMVVATSLLVLGNRSQRPIVPAIDSTAFVMSEMRLDARGPREPVGGLENTAVNKEAAAAR